MTLEANVLAVTKRIAQQFVTLSNKIAKLDLSNATAINVTPSDTVTYNPPVNKIRVGVAGDVVIADASGKQTTFTGVAAGETIGVFNAVTILASTTAGSLVGYVGQTNT